MIRAHHSRATCTVYLWLICLKTARRQGIPYNQQGNIAERRSSESPVEQGELGWFATEEGDNPRDGIATVENGLV